MKVGIGLPNAVPDTAGGEMREWARRADSAGFSTLGTIDRLVYPNHESLIALAFAAGATERIGLLTSILIAPLRTNTALLAKQAASLDVLSGGRLTLGLAVGGREDDFEASGAEFHRRGEILERQLEEIRRIWAGEAGIGPQPRAGRPGLVVGGAVEVAYRRAARFADGWMMGGGPPAQFRERVAHFEAAWADAGREETPRKLALNYVALGPTAREDARRYIGHYYAYIGDTTAFADSVPATPEDIKAQVEAFAAEGCDELILFPTSSDPEHVDLLAQAVL
jgi:alkanesulfonate monooxygenase SsuD/methylene tetrahydromethanopterin reductase-like flavin-dependent oxidoreductase (luciferase family)